MGGGPGPTLALEHPNPSCESSRAAKAGAEESRPPLPSLGRCEPARVVSSVRECWVPPEIFSWHESAANKPTGPLQSCTEGDAKLVLLPWPGSFCPLATALGTPEVGAMSPKMRAPLHGGIWPW